MSTPRVSFRITILTLFIVLTVGLSAVMLYVNYTRNSQTALAVANNLLGQAAARVVIATDHLTEPLLGLASAAVLLPGADRMGDARGGHALAPLLLALIERYPQMSSAYFGNERGDFYRITSLTSMRERARNALNAPPLATFAVQTIGTERGRRVERWRFLDAARRELGVAVYPDETYDPRERSWYSAARNSRQTIVTDYYPFASAPQVGLTIARSVGDAKGTVFATDLTLTSISRYLATVRASQLSGTRNAELALFKVDGRLLAHSDNKSARA